MNEIPQRDLRTNTGEVLRRVEAGETLNVTVSGRPIAELRPLARKPYFAPRAALERILSEAPLDPKFRRDVRDVLPDTVDKVWPQD